jgi:hypothetical protein
MISSKLALVVTSSFLTCGFAVCADEPAKRSTEFTVTMSGDIDDSNAEVVGRLTTLFHQSYPKLVKRFENPKQPAPRHIDVVFDPGIDVPAFCSGDKITVSSKWLKDQPGDIALLTHELTHAVQRYESAPGWLTEGIADYARYLYTPGEQPDWSLPNRLTKRQSYRDSYRTSAKFLVWLDEKHAGTVDKIHRKLQDGDFSIDDFEKITGKSVDLLWEECVRELNR